MPKLPDKTLMSLDTETTGVDLRHGAKPFFVTTCLPDGTQRFWEWDIDPLTREPIIPTEDLVAIDDAIASADRLVLQNAKFDQTALEQVGIDGWPWERTHDTLIAGHLLASNHPHDLTSMAIEYLGVDIQPFEDALEKAVKECRTLCKRHRPDVMLAGVGVAGMPSAKEKTWKYDTWLPRWCSQNFDDFDPAWETVLAEYANADSSVTLALWEAMAAELTRRDLWEWYEQKMLNLPTLVEMESHGVPVSKSGLNLLRDEYRREADEAGRACVTIAKEFKYVLTLPKSGNNGSLSEFCFGPDLLNLPVIALTETKRPALDKDVLAEYKKTLEGVQLRFVKNLAAKRKRDKSIEFMDSYEKYWLPTEDPDVMLLHHHLNPTATGTTRLSCSFPNLQQVSKQEAQCEECDGEGCEACGGTGEDIHSVRRVFVPPAGYEMWTADASNIELRIPTFECGEPKLVELFERPNDPPYYGSQHLLNFSIVYHDIWANESLAVGIAKVGPHCKKKYASTYYQCTKNGGLAMQYQCGQATADRSFRRPGFAKLKQGLPLMEAHNARCVEHANRYGWVETIPDRTMSCGKGYPLLCRRGGGGRIVPTTPLNYRTQGTAGCWMVKAMNRCRPKLLEWRTAGFDAWMALTVHDELMFMMPKRPAGRDGKPGNLWRMRIIQKLMEQGGDDIGVPTPVAVEHHESNWSEGVQV